LFKVNFLAAALLAVASGASAAKPQQAKSPLVQGLFDCRAQPDAGARLRCYDAAAAALYDATVKGGVVMVSQEDVRKTRRSLFGFGVPKLPFFSGDDSADEAADELTAKIVSAGPVGYGKWRVKLEDGGTWETIEAIPLRRDPKAGDEVVIKRGPLGSYMMRIAGQRAARAKRVG
jgi:hypothetical protein